jgi:hypothetical protein
LIDAYNLKPYWEWGDTDDYLIANNGVHVEIFEVEHPMDFFDLFEPDAYNDWEHDHFAVIAEKQIETEFHEYINDALHKHLKTHLD